MRRLDDAVKTLEKRLENNVTNVLVPYEEAFQVLNWLKELSDYRLIESRSSILLDKAGCAARAA